MSAAPAEIYPHSGTCAYCGRERDDLFYHYQDGEFYCADVFKCEGRRWLISMRQEQERLLRIRAAVEGSSEGGEE